MPDIVYSSGPIEVEPGVTQLRLKALNNSPLTQTVTAQVFELDGTKRLFATRSFNLSPGSSNFAIVNITNLSEIEVQFTVSNIQVLVAMFAVKALQGVFSAANSVRHAEMVNLTSPAVTKEEEPAE